MKMPKIQLLKLKKRRVFLRADLNVPIKNEKILQDFKLKSILKTINFIQKNDGKVILATHLGRPNAKSKTNFFDQNLSTKIFVNWFKENGYKIKYEIDLKKANLESYQNFGTILLLENMRFFNGEQETNFEFARILAELGDVYVNDAFGISHRDDTSITLLPDLFSKDKKTFGLLIQKEIENLNKLKKNVKQPFILILGGNKIGEKLKILKPFILEKGSNNPSKILIGGQIRQSDISKEILQSGKIVLPNDFMFVKNNIVDIGRKTIEIFKSYIQNAETIFLNGTMGIYEEKKYCKGTMEILKSVSISKSFSVIGGGDAVASSFLLGFEDKIDFLSTGGGATLEFLASKDPFKTMPGLKHVSLYPKII